MTQEVVLVSGAPASGKSTLTNNFLAKDYARLNRDLEGGSISDLIPKLSAHLNSGKSVVMDNLFASKASRALVITEAQKHSIPVRCLLLNTSFEDAQFNACLRMTEKYGHVLAPEEFKFPKYKNDPNTFPVQVMYKYRKEFEKPTLSEGFSNIETVNFTRNFPAAWKNKAVILDADGTVRSHNGPEKYPTAPDQIYVLPNRTEVLNKYVADGYLLLGVSNQSGVAKGTLTKEVADACFTQTNKLVKHDIDWRYCPHKIPPISCYCRKPGPAFGVEFIVKHNLKPSECIYVGDYSTDKTFAERCGFQFQEAKHFFGDV